VFEADCFWSFESWRTWIYEGIVENLPAPFDRAAKILCGVPSWSTSAIAVVSRHRRDRGVQRA
jgi:hypothetical protein